MSASFELVSFFFLFTRCLCGYIRFVWPANIEPNYSAAERVMKIEWWHFHEPKMECWRVVTYGEKRLKKMCHNNAIVSHDFGTKSLMDVWLFLAWISTKCQHFSSSFAPSYHQIFNVSILGVHCWWKLSATLPSTVSSIVAERAPFKATMAREFVNGAASPQRPCTARRFLITQNTYFGVRKKMLCGKRGLHAVMSDLIMHFFSRYNVSMALLFVQFFNQVGVAYKTSEGMLSFFFSFLLHLLNILE